MEGKPDDWPDFSLEIYTEMGGPDLSDTFSFRQAHIVHRLLTNVPVEAGVAFGKLLDRIAADRDEVSFR